MALDQLFADHAALEAVEISDDDRLVAAVILKEELDVEFSSAGAKRAAWLVTTASNDRAALRVLAVFESDVENLALLCSHVVKLLTLPWSGHVADLEAALTLHPRAALAGRVLTNKVLSDLRLPRHDTSAAASWRLSQKGTLFLSSSTDSAVLRNIVFESPTPIPALHRLAELGEVGVIHSLMQTLHKQVSSDVWIAGLKPLEPNARRALLLEVLRLCRARPYVRSKIQAELEEIDHLLLIA
jgi:hypothetical protein